MSPSDIRDDERRVAAARWADKWKARLDLVLTGAWADLAARLQEGVDQLSWHDLLKGPGPRFVENWIQPAVQQRVERHVEPVLKEASAEYRQMVSVDQLQRSSKVDVPGGKERLWTLADLAAVTSLPGGLALGGTALAVAIGKATSFLIFSVVVINWPILIVGLLLGAILSAFGAGYLATVTTKLRRRFATRVLPKIQEATLGDGVTRDGQHIPSLRAQLHRMIDEAATVAQ